MKSLVERQVGTRIAKMLQDIQHRQGYISDVDIARIAGQVGEPARVIQDVVSFFPHYSRHVPAKCTVAICRDMSCRLRGSVQIAQQLQELADQVGHENLHVHEASCLGRCDRAPAMIIEGSASDPASHGQSLFVGRKVDDYRRIVQAILEGNPPEADSDEASAQATMDRSEIDCYRSGAIQHKYAAVKAYLLDPSNERIIQALKNAGLLGMGGAGAPAFSKWDEARTAPGETKYVVCNADESEPGTFKDREILLAAPHLVIEGMTMAALVSGAKQGYIYIRHEYQEQIDRLQEAIEQAERLGALGANIFQSGRAFRLEVFISPGGYVCGEQTALIEALEGKRSEPRNRPPELQTNGLYDQPTILNNVETFAWVPSILLKEPAEVSLAKEQTNNPTATKQTPGLWYKYAGRNRSKGKRYFSISGDLNRPGAYEVPCGITLGELIDQYAGGMKDGIPLLAVALSGPSGGFLPAMLPDKAIRLPKILDKEGKETAEFKYPTLSKTPTDIRLLPLDVDASREIGFMLGAGIVVYGSTADLLDQAIACSQFYQRESCGKCVPCRLGSRKIVDMAQQLASSQTDQNLVPQFVDHANLLSRIMRTTSICGLGQVASEPFRTYLRYFHSTNR
ncbi:MAG: NAD(P)H-dependent oxidoreductase subunit E [Planctomycetota bacterium]|nr:NAD(P)H-dependent oxidoreductase subunit E [Planctomycetota bacterium]